MLIHLQDMGGDDFFISHDSIALFEVLPDGLVASADQPVTGLLFSEEDINQAKYSSYLNMRYSMSDLLNKLVFFKQQFLPIAVQYEVSPDSGGSRMAYVSPNIIHSITPPNSATNERYPHLSIRSVVKIKLKDSVICYFSDETCRELHTRLVACAELQTNIPQMPLDGMLAIPPETATKA